MKFNTRRNSVTTELILATIGMVLAIVSLTLTIIGHFVKG